LGSRERRFGQKNQRTSEQDQAQPIHGIPPAIDEGIFRPACLLSRAISVAFLRQFGLTELSEAL
jgi:hypothetical protein